MIQISGEEGGGQILRTAISLSAITQEPVSITNIRKTRNHPGLQPQHLAGLKAAAQLCNASLDGANIHSTKITFTPDKIKGGKYKIDVGTAGSITLILQILVPIATYADSPVELNIKGGTDVLWSPSIDYFQHVFCRYAEKLGLDIKLTLLKRGFYPKGGGEVIVKINPRTPQKINLTNQGKFQHIHVHSVASTDLQSADVCERMVEGFQSICPEENIRVNLKYEKTASTGAVLHAHTVYENCVLGVSALGEKGKTAESVGKECARNLAEEMKSKATVDQNLADQLMIFMALAKNSEIKTSNITDHVKTNKEVIEKFLPIKFQIKGNTIIC